MKKSRFTEAQIVRVLNECESGKSTKDICREYGIAAPTFYSWKKKYGGMDAQQLKELNLCNKKTAVSSSCTRILVLITEF